MSLLNLCSWIREEKKLIRKQLKNNLNLRNDQWTVYGNSYGKGQLAILRRLERRLEEFRR